MRKGLIAIITLSIATFAAGWIFFTYGGYPSPQLTDSQKEILKAQDDRLSKGSPDAPVKIIEYVDILCPYCAKSSQPGDTIPRMMEDYVDTGKAHYEVRLVAKIAPDSTRAGEGAYCAAEQDQFWAYLDKAYNDTWKQYYSQNKDVSEVALFKSTSIATFVRSIPEITYHERQRCMDDNSYAQTMKDNSTDMTSLDAYGTPTMVVDGKSHSGTPPYSAFQAVINASLNKKKAQGSHDEKTN